MSHVTHANLRNALEQGGVRIRGVVFGVKAPVNGLFFFVSSQLGKKFIKVSSMAISYHKFGSELIYENFYVRVKAPAFFWGGFISTQVKILKSQRHGHLML